MNIFHFGLKRAYYGTLRGTRRGLQDIGLSAARYDLLVAIRENELGLQYNLRQMLGIAPSTLTEMLQQLEKQGLVSRERAGDRRFQRVRLTSLGESTLAQADRWADQHWDDAASAAAPIGGRDGVWYTLFSPKLEDFPKEMVRMRIEHGTIGPYPLWEPDD